MARPTITDVAPAAGVSKGAVSFALNDRPGVSPDTRQRILEVADELGWTPSPRARALSVSKALAVGLVVARPPEMLRADAFFPAFIAGLETVLSERGHALLLQVAEHDDDATYRRLASEGRVDGVFVTDLHVDDARPALLAELGLPAVVVGPDLGDDAGCARPARRRRRPRHPRRRRATWSTSATAHRPRLRPADDGARPLAPHGVGEALRRGRAARGHLRRGRLLRRVRRRAPPRTLLDLAEPPTAIVYANDLMAMAGLSLAVARGVERARRPLGHRVRRHRDRRPPAARR